MPSASSISMAPLSSETISAFTISSEVSITTQPEQLRFIKITGMLYEKGTQKPLPRVNMYCFPASSPDKPIKTSTDNNGNFLIEVPEGKLKWVLSVSGYRRLEFKDEQTLTHDNRRRTFYLEKNSYLTYETTVYGQTEKRDDKTKSLSQEQFSTVPGANGDPVKAVQNLPGVNRTNAFSSQIIIEGSSPNDTRYNIDSQNVPIIFHFGGQSSVVMPEAIDHVDYLSAGFGPEFGQTTAGIVNLAVKDPQTDRRHGFIYADFQNAGAMIEGPLDDKSSFLFGIRQSYIGFVLGAVVKEDKSFSLTAVPDYKDTVLVYRTQPSLEDTIKIVGVGSQDTFGFLLKQPPDEDPSVRGNFNLRTQFYRVIPEWTHKFGADRISRVSFGVGEDSIHFNLGDLYYHIEQKALTARVELEDQVTEGWKSYVGFDMQNYQSDISYQFPIVNNEGGIGSSLGAGELAASSRRYNTNASGIYWRNVLHSTASPWTFLPGLRVSYFNLTNEVLPEPRVGAKYAVNNSLTLRASAGQYNQAPPAQDLDAAFGNPDLKSPRALHGTVGFEKDFKEGSSTGWTITNDLFYKRMYDLVARSLAYISPSRPEYYNNSGFGHSYGLEVLGKYRTASWEGWVSYTLSRSTRGDDLMKETISQYDQTHLLTAVGDIKFGRNWKLSTRVRYSTGNPYTPISGSIYDANNDVYTPIRGPIYSQRMGSFFQADLRFDKKWIKDTWILTAYFDLENVTNRKNPQEVTYSYDYSRSTTVSGLPIFPTLGVKAEF